MTEKKQEVTEQITEWMIKHAKTVAIVFIVAAVGGGAFVAYGIIHTAQEKKAQEALFDIQHSLEKKQQELAEAETKALEKKDDKKKDDKKTVITPPKPAEKNPEVFAKNFTTFEEQYKNFISQNQGKKASFVAAISLADLYLDYKDPKKAVDILKEVAARPAKSDLFWGLLQSQLGLALSEAGDCKEAVRVYDSVLASKDHPFLRSQNLLRKGACLMSLNEFDQARETFDQAKTEFPDTYSGEMAQSYKRLLALKKGQTN